MSETRLPLQDKRVLVTRTRDQAGALCTQLRAVGALPIELPVIRIVPPADWQPLDRALRTLLEQAAYDWLIFTSANGVRMVLERLRALGYEPTALAMVPIATIGPATAAALQEYGLAASLLPDEYIAEGVAEALRREVAVHGGTLAGKRLLLARAAEARQVLITELEQAGAAVDVVAAYRTLPASHDDERGREVVELLRQGRLDMLTFTSSSTVQHFMGWLTQAAPDLVPMLTFPEKSPLIACIGPITASTARSYGLYVAVEAREFTVPGLVTALIDSERQKIS